MAEPQEDWKRERKSGSAAIAASMAVSLLLWFALYRLLPPLEGMDDPGARMLMALKCLAVATLFTLVAGVEAVAHERLQSAAFDPLAGHETRRLRVNLRFLQNTLEQLVIFAVGLLGLAAYMTSGEAMRAVPATAIVWVLNRYAFWIGYHRSAAMRGLGAPSMAIGLIMLLYVVARIGGDIAGTLGTVVAVVLFLAVEAVLFWKTRSGA
ncbi:MAG TPA: MAPEG family protein [Sphingomicrobium sp.]|nr:MAPEG family protein [Sphingomicrobium sp.]